MDVALAAGYHTERSDWVGMGKWNRGAIVMISALLTDLHAASRDDVAAEKHTKTVNLGGISSFAVQVLGALVDSSVRLFPTAYEG